MKQQPILFFFLLSLNTAIAQDTTAKKDDHFALSGYADMYYQYDYNKPDNSERAGFIYNFKKHNQLNVNLALLKLAYAGKKWKANLALMAGNYADYNLAPEPPFFRYIYEANLSYAFSKKISVDAGILPSHIGLETAIGKDNWNLSRSILAENTPYYETGIKINYLPNEKWSFSLLALNGWQNIKDYNCSKAAGTQIQFKPNEKWLFNSSVFIGNEKPDSARQLRLFHNFYFTYNINPKLKSAILFDIGAERRQNHHGFNTWTAAAILLQYSPLQKLNIAGRIEWYKDKEGVIISNFLPQQFSISGYSVNADYNLLKNIVLRTEVRLFNSKQKFFIKNGRYINTDLCWLSSISFFF